MSFRPKRQRSGEIPCGCHPITMLLLLFRPYLSAKPTVGRFALGPPHNVQPRAGVRRAPFRGCFCGFNITPIVHIISRLNSASTQLRNKSLFCFRDFGIFGSTRVVFAPITPTAEFLPNKCKRYVFRVKNLLTFDCFYVTINLLFINGE